MNRREMIKRAGAVAAGVTILGAEAFAADAFAASHNADASGAGHNADASGASKRSAGPKKKIMVIGAHPDDPETAAGGTMALLAQAGHEVLSVYLTKGERGIVGKSLQEAADIRVPEAKAACKILGARPVFMTQIDGDTQINKEKYVEMRELIGAEKPDIVLTHWPIDGHPDHRVCSLLVYDAWRRLGYNFELFYFEVMTGTQTQVFNPTDWVDITSVAEIKEQACYCHVSQNIKPLYDEWHLPMEKFRGLESKASRAEAFIHQRYQSNDIF